MDTPPPAPPRLIVGLGNPGKAYEQTRHNVGFMLVDRLAALSGVPWSRARLAGRDLEAETSRYEGALLCKPMSYMNLSGQPVAGVARFHRIPPEQMLLVYDDVALPLGRLRLRARGSAGGHNGVRSLIEHLGTDSIARLRIGIGEASGQTMVSHVLGRFSPREEPLLQETLILAMQAVDTTLNRGLQAAMNQFN